MLSIENLYKNQFQNKNENSQSDCDFFLRDLDLPSLSEADKTFLDKDVTEEELFLSLSEMKNDKSPGNDGLTCEFYKHFWDKVKVPLFESICHAKINGELSTSQRQAIIRLIEKKDKDKTLLGNWRPISLLNVDVKILSRALAKTKRGYL